MKIFNRLQDDNKVKQQQLNRSYYKDKLIEKLMDCYPLVMGAILCLLGLSPFTIVLMQY
ncbi:MAG: hypothetical protein ACI8WB_003215 [Phenylobacterium sp.]|jgi:hypothetical protein